MAEDLLRLAKRAIRKTIIYEGFPGKIGKSDGTVYYTDSAGNFHRNRVWVRVSIEGKQTEIVARCVAVNPRLHLHVRVANREGVPTVIGLDRTYSGESTGGANSGVERHWFTHLWTGTDPAFLDPRSFMGFGVRPSNPPALTVDIKGGFYRWNGTLKQLADQTSSSLSSYRPSGSAARHFVIVCLDRPNNSIVIVDGNDKLIAAGPINRDDIDDVSISSDYWPLAAVRLVNGQTEIRLPDITHDVRLWAGDNAGPGGANFNSIVTDANGSVVVDANGNVVVESV